MSALNMPQEIKFDAIYSHTSKLAILNVSVFRIPTVSIISVALMLHYISYISILTMLSPNIRNLGYKDKEADFARSLCGAGEISKIIIGWLADKAYIKGVKLLVLTIILSGFSAILISFFDWYPALIIYSVTLGTFTSAWKYFLRRLAKCTSYYPFQV